MLKESGHKTLHRAERGAVDHHGAVLLIVGTGIFELETLREVIVDLEWCRAASATDFLWHP